MAISDKRNPYFHKNGKPWLRRSVIAFLDILGFKDFLTTAIKQRREYRSLLDIQRALDSSIERLRPPRPDFYGERDLYAIKTFTDNIIIGFPVADFDSEGPLGSILFKVALFQLEMVRAGFFVRGAITIGNLHIGEIVYGRGLLEAYRTEEELARDPRIVLGKSAYTDWARHVSYYGKPKESPQHSEWLRDPDGQIFLNYLEIFLGALEYDVTMMVEVLEIHKSRLETQLEKCKPYAALWSKYAWVAQYHNFFCRSYKENLFAKQKIAARSLSLKPTPIFQNQL